MSTFCFIFQQMLFFAIPLLVVAVGAMYCEKSGIVNIGLEGIMVMGAFTGVLVIHFLGDSLPGQLVLLLAIMTAGVTGGAVSMLHGVASVKFLADQTISGTAINLFAPAFCIFMSRIIVGVREVQFNDNFYISELPGLSRIPLIGDMFFKSCYASTFYGIAVFAFLTFVIRKTRFGLRLSACGENPEAAASAGINVKGFRYAGVLISGVLGGAGGLVLVATTSTTFNASVAGYGFLALAVLILGNWKPFGILFASLFFGLLKAVASSYSGIDFLADLNLDANLFRMVPYVLTIIILAVSSGAGHAPKSEGIPYDDGTLSMTSGAGKRRTRVIAGAFAIVIIVGAVMLNGRTDANSRAVSKGYGGEITLVTEAAGSVDDKSYNQSIWDGIISYTDRTSKTRKYYNAQNNSEEAVRNAARLANLGGGKIIIVAGSVLTNALSDYQYVLEDSTIVFTDSVPLDENGQVKLAKNAIGIDFAGEQAGFLAGYAAVMDGYRSIGYIGGRAVDAVAMFGYGFVSGAEYAARELGLKDGEVTIRYTYANTFAATPESLALASAWYQNGVEVIFACGGAMGNNVMKAAEIAGKSMIGVDVDQSGESPSVITSAMKNISAFVDEFLVRLEEGTIETGKFYRVGAEMDAVGLPFETSKFRQFTREQYDDIYARLAAGELPVFSNTTADSPESLPVTKVSVRYVK